MKKLLITIALVTTGLAKADVYLDSGESTYLRGETVYCGISQPSEKSFSCSVRVCLKSSSNMHTSKRTCEFFKGYEQKSYSTWAYSGSQAEASIVSKLDRNGDVIDYDSLSISCY